MHTHRASPKPFAYLFSIVEEEQCGISPHTILRTHLVVLSTVHLVHKYTNLCY